MYYKDLKTFFNPRSVAVVGASRNSKKVGYNILKNIIDWSFKGDVFVVNPFADFILGIKSYKSYLDLPVIPDLALIAVSAEVVLSVFKDIAKKGTKNVVIYSGGFKEAGIDGLTLEKELRNLSSVYGINVMGPNCLGFASVKSHLNATFGYAEKMNGNLRFISQSGAIATSFFDYAVSENLGFSEFVTLGNKIDINENDILGYWIENNKEDFLYKNPLLSDYKPIGIYLESFTDGLKFADLVSQIIYKDPIFILKPGDSSITQKAIGSHTGSIVYQSNFLTSILNDLGIIRCSGIQEFFDIAKAFAWENAPQGPNIAILTNAGGPAISILDHLENTTLKLAKLGHNTKKILSKIFPGRVFSNPVDILGDADSIRYAEVIDALLAQEDVDVVLAILTPQLMTEIYQTAEFISKFSQKYKKPIICSFIGGLKIQDAQNILNFNKIPNYTFPERAIIVIDKMWFWRDYVKNKKQRNEMVFFVPKIKEKDLDSCNDVIKKYLHLPNNQDTIIINPFDSQFLLSTFGVKCALSYELLNIKDADYLVDKLGGYPVVLKLVYDQILHKTDLSGVWVVNNINELSFAYEKIKKIFNQLTSKDNRKIKFTVQMQRYVSNGLEIFLGISKDPDFGYIMLFGAGGIFTEILNDFSFIQFPITSDKILRFIKKTKIYKLLTGYRTGQIYPVDKLITTMLNLAHFVNCFPMINQLEINPLIITKDDVWAVDTKIILTKYT